MKLPVIRWPDDVGMGISQSLWAGLSSIVAFGWGSVIFHEHIHNLLLSLLG